MKESNFLYTDGRNVVVTPSVLQIKGSHYNLKGITEYGLALLKPRVLPGLLATLLGLGLVGEELFHFVPTTWYNALHIAHSPGYSNAMTVIGISIAVIGVIYLSLARRRYALRIETAEGEKIVVISRSRPYVDQIIAALRRARKISRVDRDEEEPATVRGHGD